VAIAARSRAGGGFETETWVQLVPSNVQVSFRGPTEPPPKRTTVPVLHTPSLHVPVGHIAQALPPVPHALATVPARHCPEVEQHPGQDVGGSQVPIGPAPPLLPSPSVDPSADASIDPSPVPCAPSAAAEASLEALGPGKSERAPQPHASRRAA